MSAITDLNTVADLSKVWGAIWRRKNVVLSIIFLMLLMAAILAFTSKEKYRATASILLYTNNTESSLKERPQQQLLKLDDTIINSETDHIQSRLIIAQMADKLNLFTHPGFNPYMKDLAHMDNGAKSSFSVVVDKLKGNLSFLLGGEKDSLTDYRSDVAKQATIDNIREDLTVFSNDQSNVIHI